MTDSDCREAAMRCIVEMVEAIAEQVSGQDLVGHTSLLAGQSRAVHERVVELIDTALVTVTVDWEGGIHA
ncbi:MAG TPA: hypothetical protein PLQ54_02595 [Armatimonadota bacterium]|nr:hypothetical protein [Armatimonadota bacterium]